MKNLNLWDVNVGTVRIEAEDKIFISHSQDESNPGQVLYTCGHNLLVSCFSKDGREIWSKDLSETAAPENKPVDVNVLSLTDSVCVGLANGELFTVTRTSCDLVGVCDDGILAMEWSPDQELLVMVTKTMNMILMSCTFEPVHEVNLLREEFGEKQFITVGWGKKETQFHGSEGKGARVNTEVCGDPTTASDDIVKITWRGDGNLYAIGFNLDGIRQFKVFDREGHLQYTSEKQPGLESNLTWRPSGNVIATTQRKPDKHVIAFFEKNGLKHGGFDLPISETTQVEDLIWSSDSEILTIQCKDTEANTQKLLLFTMGNYHWYLKQCLQFSKDQKVCKVLWDNDFDVANNKKLHVVLGNGEYYCYTWVWSVDHSRGMKASDDAIVAVVDGNKVLVTGFRQTAVPPPMAALDIELDGPANSVHFAPPNDECVDSNSFFVVVDQALIFYEQTNKFPLQYKVLKRLYLDQFEFPFQCYNWHWQSQHVIVCVVVNKDEYSLVEYNISADKLEKKYIASMPDGVLRVQPHPQLLDTMFLQTTNGDIIQYKIGGEMSPLDVSFTQTCPKFSVIDINGNNFIGLSHKGHLYINDSMVMNNVNSFFIHSHYILLTTLKHVLLCAELTQSGIDALKEYSKTETAHLYKRKIERGGRLIIVVPCGTRTVLQMPRGNLETIQPRPLSLKIIGQYLNGLQYHEAFDLMRKERINLNLIYDHNPNQFLSHIDTFLSSVKNNSWLSLFLSDLENIDVTKTMYSSSYADRTSSTDTRNKIKKVCEIIRTNLCSNSDIDHRILPLITSYVKTNEETDLEKALTVVKELKAKENKGEKLPITSDESLKYLLYMVDVNKLFDIALGMYDFDLVLLVANKSQKDPKEFIPMLNELNEMEENYKRFTINKHLKRFYPAVTCLVDCGASKHGELKTFVKYHSLYQQALSLFKPEEEIFKQISDDFGLYLRLKKHFTEAGIAYQRGGNNLKAVECYKDASEWELAINLALSWPKDQFQQLCWDLVTGLKAEKRHTEALRILEQFYEDKEQAMLYAVESGQFNTAMRMCSQYRTEGFMENKIIPALLEEHKNLLEQVETSWCMFIKHRDRLRVVRENKRNQEEIYDEYGNRDCDLYSDAGSTVVSSSRGSTKSFRSSKNRRKHERKVASLKEGSKHEAVALVMALHSLVTSSLSLRPQSRALGLALAQIGEEGKAFLLQSSLEKLVKEMRDSSKEIWSHEMALEAAQASLEAQQAPEGVLVQGIASLEPHMRIAPAMQDINWKLNFC